MITVKPPFTPGPWRIEDGEIIATGPDNTGAAVLGVVYGADEYPCCEEDIEAECKANGRLIGASPDLLAACEAAMEVFRDMDLGHLLAFDKLDAAINKALGTEATP